MNVYGRLEEEPTPSWTGIQDDLVGREERFEDEPSSFAPLPLFKILIWSTLVVLVSVVLPFLLGLTSPEQAQDFYMGWAMTRVEISTQTILGRVVFSITFYSI